MKRLSLLAPLFVLFLAACGGSSGSGGNAGGPVTLADGAKLNVVATTIQVTALTREVGGSDIELHGIVPAGADAHEFEPVASDLKAIEGAQIVLRNGIGLDTWLDGTLKSAKNARVVTVTRGVKVRQAEEDGKKIDDPHVWHDPDNDKVMVRNIADALSAADPAHKDAYAQRSTAYQAKLDETKTRIAAIINEIPADGRKMVTNHDALEYFAQAFGLKVVGAVIPSVSTDAEPSAKETADLINTIKKEKVKAIFAESSVNPKVARTLASDAGVKIVDDLYGDSLGKPGSGAETVDGMLLINARKIADGLKMIVQPPLPPNVRHKDCLLVEDLTVAYDRKVVLRGVSAEITRGQVVGIVGPNGGGKSTLLKAILGIIPIAGGQVRLFGQPINKMRAHMACVPQREAVDWDFPVTVGDVVMMGRYPRSHWPHRPSQHDREIVDEMLSQVDMLSFRETQIGQLSGGQQQRVFIARALAQEADVLLLDEPMTGIDASTQEIILKIIEEQRQAGVIILLATHDLVSASCACDCLCCVNERMVSYGTVEETYTPENLSETFGGPVIVLGSPNTAEHVHSHLDAPHHSHTHENLGREH